MIKRLISIIIIISTLFLLPACGSNSKSNASYEIALLTDSTGLKRTGSANNIVWDGIVRSAAENKKSYKQYTAEKDTNSGYRSIASQAVENNAKLIILIGESFGNVIETLQEKYPNVLFLWIDGYNLDEIGKNTLIISYKEEQLGFMAGYAAVKDGFTKLGFQGGKKSQSITQYGCGFLLGADRAAQEMQLNKDAVSVRYRYASESASTPETQQLMADWYKSGTELVFTCGGNIYNSSVEAAKLFENKFVITEGASNNEASPYIISSVVKKMDETVYNAVNTFCENELYGGKIIEKDILSDELDISTNFSKWRQFGSENYNALHSYLRSTEITTSDDVNNLPLSLIKLTIEK